MRAFGSILFRTGRISSVSEETDRPRFKEDTTRKVARTVSMIPCDFFRGIRERIMHRRMHEIGASRRLKKE